MFRSYQPALPCSNLYIQYKWDVICYELHRKNVKLIKSSVDQRPPRTFMHLYVRPKKLQAEMERLCTIQRENRNLMQKMADIQRKGGWTDHVLTHYKPKSINTVFRQKQAIEASYGNRTLHTRIIDEHTSYNRSKFEDEYELQMKYKANLLRFPRNWREMRDEVKDFRANIRKKYVYPKTRKFIVPRKGRKLRREGKKQLLSIPDEKENAALLDVPKQENVAKARKFYKPLWKALKALYSPRTKRQKPQTPKTETEVTPKVPPRPKIIRDKKIKKELPDVKRIKYDPADSRRPGKTLIERKEQGLSKAHKGKTKHEKGIPDTLERTRRTGFPVKPNAMKRKDTTVGRVNGDKTIVEKRKQVVKTIVPKDPLKQKEEYIRKVHLTKCKRFVKQIIEEAKEKVLRQKFAASVKGRKHVKSVKSPRKKSPQRQKNESFLKKPLANEEKIQSKGIEAEYSKIQEGKSTGERFSRKGNQDKHFQSSKKPKQAKDEDVSKESPVSLPSELDERELVKEAGSTEEEKKEKHSSIDFDFI